MATTNDIVANVTAVLRGIRKTDGYHHSIAFVAEGPIRFEDTNAFPCLSVQVVRERATSYPARVRRRVIRLSVTGLVSPPIGEDRHQAARKLMEDADRALMADPTRGGLAVLTELKDFRYDAATDESGARGSCTAEIVLHENV